MPDPAIPTPGVYSPVPTFFKNEDSIRPQLDIETQLKHAKFLANSGINGLVLLGSTGELSHLTRNERIEFVSKVKNGLNNDGLKDYPIITGVAQNNIDEALTDISAFKKAGANWALVLVPNYYASSAAITQEGLIKWFTGLAHESELPILIYHFPGVSNNVQVTPKTFEILSQHRNIVGCKLSHGDVAAYSQVALNPIIKKQNFSPIIGFGHLLLPGKAVGVDGTIDALSNVFPKSLCRLFKLASEGKFDDKETQDIQYIVVRAKNAASAYGGLGIKYIANKILGFGESYNGRAPTSENLSEPQANGLESVLEDIIKLESSL